MGRRFGAAAAWMTIVLTGSGGAFAAEGKDTKAGSPSGTSSQPGGAPAEGMRPPGGEDAAPAAGAAGEPAETEEPLWIGVDLVIGSGTTNVANTASPSPVEAGPINSVGTARITTESLMFGAGVDIGRFGFGARFPLTFGTINPSGLTSRETVAFGNVEVEGEFVHKIRHDLELRYALGVTLPTAQGKEVPPNSSGLEPNQSGVLDQNSYDRAALNLAAASVRGFEDNAMFELDRVGVIPKVTLTYRWRALVVEPWVKLENLIDTSGSADHKYLAELVVGARAGYLITPHVEPGVRVWMNTDGALNGISGDGPVAVVEPEVRFPFHYVTPMIGGILPFAGPLTNPYFFGIRVAAVARF
jgi:hypothetical protein